MKIGQMFRETNHGYKYFFLEKTKKRHAMQAVFFGPTLHMYKYTRALLTRLLPFALMCVCVIIYLSCRIHTDPTGAQGSRFYRILEKSPAPVPDRRSPAATCGALPNLLPPPRPEKEEEDFCS